jgi:hypothetical protein
VLASEEELVPCQANSVILQLEENSNVLNKVPVVLG